MEEKIKNYLKNSLKMVIERDYANSNFKTIKILLDDVIILKFGIEGSIYPL